MRPLLWLPMAALKLAVVLLGIVAVPLMLATKARPLWLWRPWLNPKELLGVPDWFIRGASGIKAKYPRFWWNAIRNPANGLRTYPLLTVVRRPERIEWRDNNLPTNPSPLRRAGKRLGWFYAWQGVYSGLWVCVIWSDTHHAKVRLGWKIVPDEEQFDDEWKPHRAGFAMAFLPYRNG